MPNRKRNSKNPFDIVKNAQDRRGTGSIFPAEGGGGPGSREPVHQGWAPGSGAYKALGSTAWSQQTQQEQDAPYWGGQDWSGDDDTGGQPVM